MAVFDANAELIPVKKTPHKDNAASKIMKLIELRNQGIFLEYIAW